MGVNTCAQHVFPNGTAEILVLPPESLQFSANPRSLQGLVTFTDSFSQQYCNAAHASKSKSPTDIFKSGRPRCPLRSFDLSGIAYFGGTEFLRKSGIVTIKLGLSVVGIIGLSDAATHLSQVHFREPRTSDFDLDNRQMENSITANLLKDEIATEVSSLSSFWMPVRKLFQSADQIDEEALRNEGYDEFACG